MRELAAYEGLTSNFWFAILSKVHKLIAACREAVNGQDCCERHRARPLGPTLDTKIAGATQTFH